MVHCISKLASHIVHVRTGQPIPVGTHKKIPIGDETNDLVFLLDNVDGTDIPKVKQNLLYFLADHPITMVRIALSMAFAGDGATIRALSAAADVLDQVEVSGHT